MTTFNNGGVPGSHTPIEKGPGAYDSKALKTHINALYFRTAGAFAQTLHAASNAIYLISAYAYSIRAIGCFCLKILMSFNTSLWPALAALSNSFPLLTTSLQGVIQS